MQSDEIKECIKDLDSRVKTLEYNEIRRDDKIEALCDKLDEVLDSSKKLVKILTTGFITSCFSLIIYLIEMHIR